MPFFRRSDPEITVDETSYAKWKSSGEGRSWLSSLKNEAASAQDQARSQPAPRVVERQAADRYVWESAERLESTRPTGRSRRSPDPDRGGFFAGGIFAARKPDVGGRIPFERWPGETRGGQGCSCGHPKCMR